MVGATGIEHPYRVNAGLAQIVFLGQVISGIADTLHAICTL
jgi:hypothetical protein